MISIFYFTEGTVTHLRKSLIHCSLDKSQLNSCFPTE